MSKPYPPSKADQNDKWQSKNGNIERTPLKLLPRTPLDSPSTEPRVNTNKPNPFGTARPREVVLAERGEDYKEKDADIGSRSTSSRPWSAQSDMPWRAKPKDVVANESKGVDIAKMLGEIVISPRNEVKSIPELLSHDLEHPASKEAASKKAMARYQERSRRRTESGGGGSQSVAAEDYKKIKENLYKLPRMGYEDLAKELRIEESVLRKGVYKFFILEEKLRSPEVKEVVNTRLREKTQETEKEEETQEEEEEEEEAQETEKQQEEEETEKQEEEEEEEEEEETKETKDLRELALHRVLMYMEWSTKKSFSTIEMQHGISLEGQKKIIIFFMEFKESLGYLDGEAIEDEERNGERRE